MFNNLVANLISNIRVAMQHKRHNGRSHYSKLGLVILNKLSEKNIVDNVRVEMQEDRKFMLYDLPNHNFTYFISHIFCYYKVSAYKYMGKNQIKTLMEIYDEGLVSTTSGVMFVRECMKKQIGGKVILLYR